MKTVFILFITFIFAAFGTLSVSAGQIYADIPSNFYEIEEENHANIEEMQSTQVQNDILIEKSTIGTFVPLQDDQIYLEVTTPPPELLFV